MLENFRRAFSPGSTDCPWVSEDVIDHVGDYLLGGFLEEGGGRLPSLSHYFN